MVGVFSLSTGALLDLAMAPWSGKETGEHAQLMYVFDAGDIILGDAYYGSFFLIAILLKMNLDAVFPMHASRHYDFRKGKRLGKKDHIIEWTKPAKPEWMDVQIYADYPDYPDTIKVRETTIVNARPGHRTRSRVLVTTEIFLQSIVYKKVGNRPDCSEPRMVKRRPKAFPRLQKPRNLYHQWVA